MTDGATTGPAPAERPHATAPVQFYIPATSSILERRPRTLKHGDTFGVFDHYGNVVYGENSPEGLYHKDTRYLSDLRLFVNGRGPLLLSSTVKDNNALLTVDLTNPDFATDGRLDLPRNTIYLVRSKFLWDRACYERIGIRNFDLRRRHVELTFHFAADFADIFEVRGHKRPRRGKTRADVTKDGVTFSYRGLDGRTLRTVVRFEPPPARVDHESVLFRLDLPPGGSRSLFATVSCEDAPRPPAVPFFRALRDARRALRAATAGVASVESSNEIFNEVLCRTMADLYMLITDTPQGPFPYAGIPWFSTAFGRDAIVTAIEMLWIDPAMARGVLKYLAAMQARENRPEVDAEPGKILHETRAGEMARLGEVPFSAYYGSVDSTPLFVVLAGLYFERSGDLRTLAELWPNIEAALYWIDAHGDRDCDGFVEYGRRGKNGLVNQGWKDSGDSIFHADGGDAEGPIALCEVQGYVYLAKRLAAKIAAALGFSADAEKLRCESASLQARFEAAFWCEEIGTYALALDGRKQPLKVRSSNAGQVLFSGIASGEHALRVADQLLGADFFSGWGIRTVGSAERRYNPMSYHNGSVWPHDNALIGMGFARYGLKQLLQRLFCGLFDAATYMDLRRLPELFCGFRRTVGNGPTSYPVACSPQAWSCAVPFALLQACLGLELDHAAEQIRFRQPCLPPFLDAITIRSLSVGTTHCDILLRRDDAGVSVSVLQRYGSAEIAVTL
jgi:glycogen debranching enzyme